MVIQKPLDAASRIPLDNLLGEIFAVEFVHALDDGLKELAGGGVVGLLGDGDDADSSAPQHGLEGDGVLALAGEAGEFPDENLLEGSLGLGWPRSASFWNSGRSAMRPLSASSTYSRADQVVVLLGVVPERPKLGGDGQVHVLAVAGHSCVEGHWYQIESVIHQSLLLVFHSWSVVRRERSRSSRSRLRHSRSSMNRRMA